MSEDEVASVIPMLILIERRPLSLPPTEKKSAEHECTHRCTGAAQARRKRRAAPWSIQNLSKNTQ